MARAREPSRVSAAAAAAARSVALAAALGALAGCAGGPTPREGTVRFRDQAGKGGAARAITITTQDPSKLRGGIVGAVAKDEMGELIYDLEEIGLFDLHGRADAPAELPHGAISVDVTGRRFLVTAKDLLTTEDARAYARSTSRIVEATQGGPHFTKFSKGTDVVAPEGGSK